MYLHVLAHRHQIHAITYVGHRIGSCVVDAWALWITFTYRHIHMCKHGMCTNIYINACGMYNFLFMISHGSRIIFSFMFFFCAFRREIICTCTWSRSFFSVWMFMHIIMYPCRSLAYFASQNLLLIRTYKSFAISFIFYLQVQLANQNQLGDHYASKHPKEKPPSDSGWLTNKSIKNAVCVYQALVMYLNHQ